MPGVPTESAQPTIIQTTAATSLGELLTPFLLLIGEVCVGFAVLLNLAITVGFAGEANPLVPFWGLLLIMLIFYVLARFFHRRPQAWLRHGVEPLSWLLLSVGFALFFVWENNYAQNIPFFSPDWLIALLHTFIPVSTTSTQFELDAIQVNIIPAIQTVVLALLAGIYCWRGYRLKNKQLTSSEIDSLFTWGSCVLVLTVVIFIVRFTAHATILSPQIPAWLCSAFFVCVLTARSLAHASYLRRFHRAGLWGSAVSQERIIWIVMGGLALGAILLAIFLGSATAPATTVRAHHPKGSPGKIIKLPHPKGQPVPTNWLFVLLAVLVIVAIIAYLFWRRYRKLQNMSVQQKNKAKQAKDTDELHETLFNWHLFLAQIKSLFISMLMNLNPFRRKQRGRTEQSAIDDILLAEPATRSIRQIYRALLKRAANIGQPRAMDETPYEFRQRLHAGGALSGPELELITEAYVLARYSGNQPGENDVSRVKTHWETLKTKWP